MHNSIIPTPQQCLELREAGFPQKTNFWYVRLNARDFNPEEWVEAFSYNNGTDMLFINHPFQATYLERNYGFDDQMIIEKLAAPTLGEIELQGDYRAIFNAYTRWHIADFRENENALSIAQNQKDGLKVFNSELEARIAYWLEINKEKNQACNGNCGENICDEYGCQERKPAKPYSIESTE